MGAEIVGNRIKELMKIEGIKEKDLADNLKITLAQLEKNLEVKKNFILVR